MTTLLAALQSEDVAAARAAGPKIYGRDLRDVDGNLLRIVIGSSPAFDIGEEGDDGVNEPLTQGLLKLKKILQSIVNHHNPTPNHEQNLTCTDG